MPPSRTASIRAEFHDDFTAKAAVAEGQAHRTGRAFRDMDLGAVHENIKELPGDLDKTNKKLDENEKTTKRSTNALDKLNTKVLAFRNLQKLMKPLLIVAAINAAMPAIFALGAGVLALAGNMARMVGVAGAIPGALFAILGVAAAAKLGLSGVGAAIKALNANDPTAISKAMQELSPQARALARDIGRLRFTIRDLKWSASEAMMPGLRSALASAVRLVPTATNLLRTMGGVVGDLANNAATMVASGPWQSDINILVGRSGVAMRTLGTAVLNLFDAVRHVAIAAGPMAQALAELIARGAAWAQTAAFSARSTGRMGAFFDRSLITLRQWGRILANLTVGLFRLFTGGARLGQSLTDSLEALTGKFRAWATSAEGQRKITAWFDSMRPILYELGALVGDLAKAFYRISEANKASLTGGGGIIGRLRDFIPTIEKLLSAFGPKLGNAIVDLANSFLKLLAALPVGTLTTTVMVMARMADALTYLSAIPGFGPLVTTVIALAVGLKAVNLAMKFTGITEGIKLVKELAAGYTALTLAEGSSVAMHIGHAAAVAADAVVTGALAAASFLAAQAMMLLDAAMSPWFLIPAIIAAVVIGFVLLYQHWQPFHDLIDNTWTFIQDHWPLLLGMLTGPFGMAVALIYTHWNTLFDFFTGLPGRIASMATGMWNGIYDAFVAAINAIIRVWNALQFDIPGFDIGPVSWGGFTLGVPDIPQIGDTSVAVGRGGSLARTLGIHSAIDSKVAGSRRVTNMTYGKYAGSDHRMGRALDIVGSGLNTYRSSVQAMGGYAEFHGTGPQRHLHAVYGDTLTSVGSDRAGDAGGNLIVHGPLVHVDHVTNDVDIEAAAYRAISRWQRDRRERL